MSWRHLARGCPGRASCLARPLGVRGRLLARNNVDEKIKHIGLGKSGGNVRTLQGASLVIFRVNPCAHGQLGDEYIATLGEQDWRLCRDHLDLGVGFHDFLYPSEWQLVYFVVVIV